MNNLTEHKCKGKCPKFKEEQCNHCLVGIDMGDDTYLENRISGHCKVIESDEAVHLSRALKAQGEVS
ncbi:MAG: hypothetical protein E6667_06910 [Acinetobacter junii]|nr:hypothetical protein [Acinetobacter junii]